MKSTKTKPEQGFTLLELMVSMALGLIVMAAMASLFKSGMNSIMLVTQRAENQQNMRAAVDLMMKDLSMAGAGLPSGGIQLPSGAGQQLSKFGCDQGGTCHVTSFNYPPATTCTELFPATRTAWKRRRQHSRRAGAGGQRHRHVVYCDYNFPLLEYTITFVPAPTEAGITLAPNPIYAPGTARH